ncbi:hypothetical protein ABHV46_13085 [Asaia sp. BMEF1]|uniref:hypothetical protein n=1 Tax=Asaia sp. BMEF1 TaxID=3155932 RepID=UPI003F67D9C4
MNRPHTRRLHPVTAAYRRLILCVCLGLMLAGCAPRTQPDMDVGAGTSDDPGQSTGAQQGRAGGGPSGSGIWPEIARTALQTGMGFLHH